MANLRYVFPWARLTPTTITNLGTDAEDSAYPLTNLFNLAPHSITHLLTGSHALSLQFDFGSAITPDLFCIFNHNLIGGGPFNLYANSAASWASPPYGPITIPGTNDANYLEGDYYLPNSWVDLTGTRTYRYWKLSGVGANTANAPWIIGEIFFSGFGPFTLSPNISYPLKDIDVRDGSIVQKTRGGVDWVVNSVARRRRLQTSIDINDAAWPTLRSLYRNCGGRDTPMVIIPEPGTGLTNPPINDARLVRWDMDLTRQQVTFDRNTVDLSWLEVSPGQSAYTLGF